ncbi:Alpha/beta hydrolase family-domain-containing protein [Mycena floridula]|nr:Alpha/beta hydrolase family-domain-containing protein [Mycena floridula]
MALHIQSFILDPDGSANAPGIPRRDANLKVAAKRYTVGDSANNGEGLTLLFAHCIGAHKEQWEPVIEKIFSEQQSKPSFQRIREAWAFDWQNHGDSAVLNKDLLQPEGISIYVWAEHISAFVRSDRMKGHRLVIGGHSAGAGCIMLTTKDIPLSEIPYIAVILIEPTMVTQELFYQTFDERMATMVFTVEATSMRRDTWPTRDEAFIWMSKRFPWRKWDPRAVRLLVDHGLQDTSTGAVTLKCDRNQESLSYPDVDGHFEAPLELARVCQVLPIHIIWGNEYELVPDELQASLCDISQGRTVASVSKVENAGHMVVQEKPDLLAVKICEILDSVRPPTIRLRSRL